MKKIKMLAAAIAALTLSSCFTVVPYGPGGGYGGNYGGGYGPRPCPSNYGYGGGYRPAYYGGGYGGNYGPSCNSGYGGYGGGYRGRPIEWGTVWGGQFRYGGRVR